MTKHLLLKTLLAAFALPALLISCQKEKGLDNLRFAASPTQFTVDSKAQKQTFTITSPAAWNISSDADWVDPGMSGGNSGRTIITLDIKENTDKESRSAKLTITPKSGSPLKISVTQFGTNGGVATNVNEWIFTTLKRDYYWNKAVQNAKPNYNLDYDEFLEDLIVNLDGARDADGTIDGGFYSDGERYVYSYIEDPVAATRAIYDEFNRPDFGFGILPDWAANGKPNIECLVTWIREGSPAEKAGLKRGMILQRFNGRLMSHTTMESVYEDFLDAYLEPEAGMTVTVTPSGGSAISLTAETIELTPILKNKIVTSDGGKKVAYFHYTDFEIGPEQGRDKYKFVEDMRKVFGEFKSKGATELVIDLRYNGGGYTYCAQVLSSLAGNVNTGQVFNDLRRNEDLKNSKEFFLAEPNGLKLNKVYFLTTGSTASASELVMHGLEGVEIQTVRIGETTEGKNVGMDQEQTIIGGLEYTMWPITFKSYNAKGETSNPTGMDPHYEVYDFTTGQPVYDLGDPQEPMLKAALDLIDGRQPQISGRMRAAREFHASPELLPRGNRPSGMRVLAKQPEDAKPQNQ